MSRAPALVDNRLRAALRYPACLLPGAVAVMVTAFALVPQGRLACADPLLRTGSPDGAYAVTVCYRPMWLAMPGGGGDGDGWVVLRDQGGAILGVVDLRGPIEFQEPTRWSRDSVLLPLNAGFDLPQPAPPPLRWFRDRVWRVRALLGFVPSDAAFR